MRCSYQVGKIVCVGQPREEALHVRIRVRIAGAVGIQNGVVDVVGRLLPRVEDDLLLSVVRVQRGDHPLDRVVEEHRADADAHVELETMRVS